MLNNQFSMFNIQSSRIPYLASLFFILSSCSLTTQLSNSVREERLNKMARAVVLSHNALTAAHVGICIFEPSTNSYWYEYQADKYFVPASNTKIPTCYAAMKYLGDSLVGMWYTRSAHAISVEPNGDPTFLLPEFKNQPMLDFLMKSKREVFINIEDWKSEPLGSGWSWNDFQEPYMAERSILPMYGNTIRFSGKQNGLDIVPRAVVDSLALDTIKNDTYVREVERSRSGNRFKAYFGEERGANVVRTFDTENGFIIEKLLTDTLKLDVHVYNSPGLTPNNRANREKIKTQPTDSLLKPMMHRSDNFFAEQTLLMVSNEKLGFMNDAKIIDSLLKTDFSDLPQKPRWVDGSGLSRYNLFTPQDFVAILNKMNKEFGMERIKVILPTGGEGTISSYYKADSGYVYGKTGTLSGVVAFSGFLYTRKGKLLIFSTLVNNHQASATDIRRAVEKFLQGIRNKY